jgi:hypothetical protein
VHPAPYLWHKILSGHDVREAMGESTKGEATDLFSLILPLSWYLKIRLSGGFGGRGFGIKAL